MAERYGVLPSVLIATATTQDIWIFDVATSYQHYLNEKQRRAHKQPTGPTAATPEMAEQLAEFKRKTNENKS